MNQVKKMTPHAPSSAVIGSALFTPHQTVPSMNC